MSVDVVYVYSMFRGTLSYAILVENDQDVSVFFPETTHEDVRTATTDIINISVQRAQTMRTADNGLWSYLMLNQMSPNEHSSFATREEAEQDIEKTMKEGKVVAHFDAG